MMEVYLPFHLGKTHPYADLVTCEYDRIEYWPRQHTLGPAENESMLAYGPRRPATFSGRDSHLSGLKKWLGPVEIKRARY